jgi:hypothetical protein
VHAYDGCSSDASTVVSATTLGLTSTGACVAPFADARGDAGGGVPPLGHMSVAPSPELRVVVGPVRRLRRRGSQCGALMARAREPRALAGLMRRFSRSEHGEGVSPVAAPALPLMDSLAHAVALGGGMPAEGVEPTRPADVPRHSPNKAAPDEAAAPAPYLLLEHVGEPALLKGTLECPAYGDRAAVLRERVRRDGDRTGQVPAVRGQPRGQRSAQARRAPGEVECIERVRRWPILVVCERVRVPEYRRQYRRVRVVVGAARRPGLELVKVQEGGCMAVTQSQHQGFPCSECTSAHTFYAVVIRR